MKGFDLKFLSELKSKNLIEDIASKYVHLEQRGGNFWGRCPFHHEKTASFCINSTEQFYYCFGCHKSGDVISFIMEIEALDFNDAVKFLADRVHMPLPEIKIDDEKLRAQRERRQRLLAVLKDTAKYYCANLYSGLCPSHEEYVLKRKLTAETLAKFGIGASIDYNGLINHLKSKGYSYEEMVDSGVAGKSEKTGRVNYYDALAGRLIIPVIDQFGNVVAFCGRIIEKKENVGKYVNTRETQIFSKGKTLFNLNNLKKLKNESGIDSVIIVEGHMDVISLVQAGIKNVVASMGTALTKDQARILKRYAEKVLISYDGDSAGQTASIRGLEILKEEGLEVKVVSLPEGLDPDDVITKFGVAGYRDCLANAKPLIDFKLDILKKSHNLNTVDGKRKFVVQAVKVIKESSSPAEQEDLLKTVRELTGVTLEALKRELFNAEADKPQEAVTAPVFSDDAGDKEIKAARFVLSSYLYAKPYVKDENIGDLEFVLPVHKEICRYIIEGQNSGAQVRFNDLYEMLNEDSLEELSRIGGMEMDKSRTYDETKLFNDCIKTLKQAKMDRAIKNLTVMFNNETDTEKRRSLAKEMALLISKKNKLNF